MIVLPTVVLIVVVYFAVRAINGYVADAAATRRRRAASKGPKGSRQWDPVTEQLARQVKGVPRPREDRDAITAFIEDHDGVEAYVEPKTVMSPLTAVLVDGDGEWKRFELAEDRLLRQLAKTHRLKVFDASRVGYPPRMKRSRRTDPRPAQPDPQAGPDVTK